VRTLLTRPLYALTGLLFASSIALLLGSLIAYAALPRSIGSVSDYGAVLDRHGRDRLNAQIDALDADFGVNVLLLATWENPLPSIDAFADALLASWGLEAQGPTLLAVFLKTEDAWTHALVATHSFPLQASLPDLSAGLQDLVDHGRIEEAMVHLLERVRDALGGIASAASTETAAPTARTWLIPVVLASIAATIWIIHHRVCPRCGRILRLQRGSWFGGAASTDAVYFCRSCGFRRHRSRLRKR